MRNKFSNRRIKHNIKSNHHGVHRHITRRPIRNPPRYQFIRSSSQRLSTRQNNSNQLVDTTLKNRNRPQQHPHRSRTDTQVNPISRNVRTSRRRQIMRHPSKRRKMTISIPKPTRNARRRRRIRLASTRFSILPNQPLNPLRRQVLIPHSALPQQRRPSPISRTPRINQHHSIQNHHRR